MGIVINLLFLGASLLIYNGKRQENRNGKYFMYGLGMWWICFAIALILWILGDLQMSGYYKNNIFYGDFDVPNSNFQLLALTGSIIAIIGMAIFVFSFELIVKRTKFILTVINILLIIILVSLPFEFFYIISGIGILYNSILFFIIMFKLTKSAQPEIRAVAIHILFGYLLITIGLVLSVDTVKELNIIPLELSPILYIIGILITIYPMIVSPEHFSRSPPFLLKIGVVIFSLNMFFLMYFIIIGLIIEMMIINLIVALLLMYSIHRVRKLTKSSVIIEKDETKLHDLLGTFTRPQKVTEEEVMISKEKKICLVCKGKVGGYNFLCTECGAFYCEKCAHALTNLENVCWVCDMPFDKSKPSKPFEKAEEEKDIEISEKIQKKPKKDTNPK
jgi:hypothetical protein